MGLHADEGLQWSVHECGCQRKSQSKATPEGPCTPIWYILPLKCLLSGHFGAEVTNLWVPGPSGNKSKFHQSPRNGRFRVGIW